MLGICKLLYFFVFNFNLLQHSISFKFYTQPKKASALFFLTKRGYGKDLIPRLCTAYVRQQEPRPHPNIWNADIRCLDQTDMFLKCKFWYLSRVKDVMFSY